MDQTEAAPVLTSARSRGQGGEPATPQRAAKSLLTPMSRPMDQGCAPRRAAGVLGAIADIKAASQSASRQLAWQE